KKGFTDYLSALDAFSEDRDPLIMGSISDDLFSLYLVDPENDKLKARLLEYLHKFNSVLGEPAKGEKHALTVARGAIRSRLVQLDHEYAKQVAGSFSKYDTYDPNLRRSLALAYALTENNASRLIEKIKSTKKDDARQHLIYSLGYLGEARTIP
ncbi:tricorn protease interacting factor F2, partial [mine drainage metagenome]